VALTSGAAAATTPITFVCSNPYQPGGPPFTIDLDPAHRAVTQSVSASQNVPASSTKYAATFDARKIKHNSGSWTYTIDRTTGDVSADGGGAS
jgi:hypothetical protein